MNKYLTTVLFGLYLISCDREQKALDEQYFGSETNITLSGRTQTNDSIVLMYRDRAELIDTVIYSKQFSINYTAYEFYDDNVIQMWTNSPDSCYLEATDGVRRVFSEHKTQAENSVINISVQLSGLE